ncbi:hypothetical protein BegalDRAFT_0965 [Beggiatoa alba B18LD]|uniref:VCBS repeat-containing protein n=1 Tax=Beggiatoa alba B18LD TaxID=395493 RepID=I3CE27_9GAMM|nr:hypothetical protein [Beggiatoa alba]EIJ41870.1 hypothetical protein BegalDRAFT_0965 [Beggiatoa alba B18LD]
MYKLARYFLRCLPALILPASSMATDNCAFQQIHVYETLEFTIQGTGCDTHQWEIQVKNEDKPFTQLKGSSPRLQNAWVTDIDGDGNPEVILQMQNAGEKAEGSIRLLELVGTHFNPEQTLPVLSAEEQAQYQGHDNFTVEDGQIVRDFSLGKETKQIFYQFVDKKLVVKVP